MGAPLPPPPDVVLFDAGNTLIFFDEHAATTALRDAGFDLDPARLRAAHGDAKRAYERAQGTQLTHTAAWDLYVGALLEASGLDAQNPSGVTRDAVDCLRAAHARHNLWCRPAADALEALTALRAAGLRLGVVSNSEGTVEAVLREVGLAPLLEVILDSHHEGVEKPDARIFHRAVARLDQRSRLPRAARVVYVGDVPRVDVEGSRAAGLEPILIDTYGHYPAYDACARIEKLTELPAAWASSRKGPPGDAL